MICRKLPVIPFGVEGEHAQHAKAEVADAAVGDEFLEIALRVGAEGPVNHSDDCEQADQRQCRST